MNTLNLTQPFSLTQDPVFVQINDEIVVMSPKDDQNYALNPVGAALWNLLESQSMTQEEMADYLTQIYEVDKEQAMADVSAFIQTMMDHDLVGNNTPTAS